MTPLPCLPASIPFPHPRNAEIWATALAGPTQTGFLRPHPLKADVFKRAHFARRLQAFEELMHATCSEPGLTQSKSSKGLLVPGIGKTSCWELRAKGEPGPGSSTTRAGPWPSPTSGVQPSPQSDVGYGNSPKNAYKYQGFPEHLGRAPWAGKAQGTWSPRSPVPMTGTAFMLGLHSPGLTSESRARGARSSEARLQAGLCLRPHGPSTDRAAGSATELGTLGAGTDGTRVRALHSPAAGGLCVAFTRLRKALEDVGVTLREQRPPPLQPPRRPG